MCVIIANSVCCKKEMTGKAAVSLDQFNINTNRKVLKAFARN